MIIDNGNNILMMYKGDTGTIGFEIDGYENGDKYLFAIKKTLEDEEALQLKTFTSSEFTFIVNKEISQTLNIGDYFWGLKLFRETEESSEIDTLIGKGILKIRRGV